MTTYEVRNMIKNMIIAQGGKIYNYNLNNIRNLGATFEQVNNAYNYIQFSPQQEKFRKEYMA